MDGHKIVISEDKRRKTCFSMAPPTASCNLLVHLPQCRRERYDAIVYAHNAHNPNVPAGCIEDVTAQGHVAMKIDDRGN